MLSKERTQRDADELFDMEPLVKNTDAALETALVDDTMDITEDAHSIESSSAYDADDESDCSVAKFTGEVHVTRSSPKQSSEAAVRFNRPCPTIGLTPRLRREIIEWMLEVRVIPDSGSLILDFFLEGKRR